MTGNENTKSIKWLMIVWLIIILLFFVFIYYQSRLPEEEPFKNKIKLSLKWERVFTDTIAPNWEISQFGELICSTYYHGNLYFINIADGAMKKEKSLSKKSYVTEIKIKGNKIFAVVDNKELYILDSKSGKVIKSIKSDKKNLYNENIIIYKDYLIFWEDNGKITVLNINSGKILNKSLFFSDHLFYVDIYEDIIYYSKKGYNVYALNLETLNEIWHYDIGDDHVHTKPILLNRNLYLSVKEKILVFNSFTGDIKDRYQIDVKDIFADSNNLYTNGNVYLYKIDSKTGKIIWQYKEKVFDVMFEKENIFFQSAKEPIHFIKLNKFSGEKIWQTNLDHYKFDVEKVKSTEKYDIIERNDGSIFILDKNTGEKLWKFNKTVNRKKLKWTVYNEILIISDGGNKFYAYDLK